MPLPSASPPRDDQPTHNLLGQKLGRKGRETRARIVEAALETVSRQAAPDCTLTRIAQRAGVGLTTLYLYFPDLGALLLDALAVVMAKAEDAFLGQARVRWPDDALAPACDSFLRAHYGFWSSHAAILHLRNTLSDASDVRVLEHRAYHFRPLIDVLAFQMDGADDPACGVLATALALGMERQATALTDANFAIYADILDIADPADFVASLLAAQTEIITATITGRRRKAATG